MPVEIKVTPAGESITHATLSRWLKPEGAAVKAGEPVAELETDKATKEEYAPAAGVLSIAVQPGTRVPIGAVIGSVDPAGVPKAAAAPAKSGNAAPAPAKPSHGNDDVRLSPAARVLADSRNVDVAQIVPSGRGVVTKSDILAHLESKPAAAPAPAP